jgi:hypothetical protein
VCSIAEYMISFRKLTLFGRLCHFVRFLGQTVKLVGRVHSAGKVAISTLDLIHTIIHKYLWNDIFKVKIRKRHRGSCPVLGVPPKKDPNFKWSWQL